MEVGLVILAAEHRITKQVVYTVFVSKRKPFLYVKALPSVNPALMSVEEERAIERLKQKQQSIKVGDFIKFDPVEGVLDGVITEYEREKKVAKTRIREGRLQVLDDILLAKNDSEAYVCYSKRFGFIDVDRELGERFLENVVFSCWLSVQLHLNGVLEVELKEFFDLSSNQQFANRAPWNFENPIFRRARFTELFGPDLPATTTEEIGANASGLQETTGLASGFSAGDQIETSYHGAKSVATPRLKNTVLQDIFGIRGLVVDDRTVIYDYGNIPTLIGYLDQKNSVVPGDLIVFDASYNQFLGIYVTKSYVVSRNKNQEICGTLLQISPFRNEESLEMLNKNEAEKHVLNLPSGFLNSGPNC